MKNTEEISNWQALIAESLQNLPPNINALDVSEKIFFFNLFLWVLQKANLIQTNNLYSLDSILNNLQKGGFHERSYTQWLKFIHFIQTNVDNALSIRTKENNFIFEIIPLEFLDRIKIPDVYFKSDEIIAISSFFHIFNNIPWPSNLELEGGYFIGTLFEQLISREKQKSSGSFYTPREISTQMCQMTIEEYLRGQINKSFISNNAEFSVILEDLDKDALILLWKSLDQLSILDPAAGTGHFLECMIDVLLGIEKSSGILFQIWSKTQQYPDIMNEIYLGDQLLVDVFHGSDLEIRFRLLCQYCLAKWLFGIDINPEAIAILKARLQLRMIFLFIHLDSELRSAFLVENEFDYALTEFNTHYLIGDGLSNQLPFERRFSVIIGNPPFGGNANLEAMQWLPDVALSKMNLAKLFLFRSLDLAIPGGIICFLMPKAITYTSDWKSIRNATSPFIWCLIDIKQAFEGVLLEQVIVTLKNQVPNEMCRISGSLSMTEAIWVKKSMFQDTWNCDLSKQDIILLQSILIEDKITKHLRTFRGLALQKYASMIPSVDSQLLSILSGKEIQLFKLKSLRRSVDPDKIPQKIQMLLKKYQKTKLVFQNIVAFISKPVHHIRVMGALDFQGIIPLDTVNILEPLDPQVDPLFILGLMNSVIFNWLLHRLAFNRAVRTMHLDNYALSKVPWPVAFSEYQATVITQVQDLIDNGMTQDRYLALENTILLCYGLNISNMTNDYLAIIHAIQHDGLLLKK